MVRVGADEGKRFISAACEAHLMIDDAALDNNAAGQSIKVTFSLLAATDPQQVGKTMSEFFPVEGKAVGKTWDLAEAVGLIAAGVDRKSTPLEFDETRLKGFAVLREN